MFDTNIWLLYTTLKELVSNLEQTIYWRNEFTPVDNLEFNMKRLCTFIIAGSEENDADEENFNFIFDTNVNINVLMFSVSESLKITDLRTQVSEIPDVFRSCCEYDNEKRDNDGLSARYIESTRLIAGYFANFDGRTSDSQENMIRFHLESLERFRLSRLSFNKNISNIRSISNSSDSKIVSSNFKTETVEQIIEELYSLIGLEEVKSEVSSLVNFIKIREMRKSKGMPIPAMSFHLVFMGNPGTGKTTVARLIAKIYHKLGILSTDNFIEVDRSDLVAGYVGQTALKVKDVIDRSRNGVLFIDEAYTLSSGSENDYGKEAIEVLLKAMEDNRDNMVVIVAGYSSLMPRFLDSNPGLKSRFNRHIVFSDYSKEEMLDIFKKMASDSGYMVDKDCIIPAISLFEILKNSNNSDFSNARAVRNIFESCIARQANRLSSLNNITDSDLLRIDKSDLPIFSN